MLSALAVVDMVQGGQKTTKSHPINFGWLFHLVLQHTIFTLLGIAVKLPCYIMVTSQIILGNVAEVNQSKS